jgi:hypothetical protein
VEIKRLHLASLQGIDGGRWLVTGSSSPIPAPRCSSTGTRRCCPVLAVLGGLSALRTEAVLQTLLVFLGFNVAWLLLLDDRKLPHVRRSAETE